MNKQRARRRARPFLASLLATVALAACGFGGDDAPSGTSIAPRFERPSGFDPVDRTGDAPWDDGLAEVATYATTRFRHGRVWTFETTLVAHPEQLDAAAMYPSGQPAGNPSLSSVRVTTLGEMPTHNVPYHFATTSHVRRDDPFILARVVTSTSDWSGIATTRFRGWTAPAELLHVPQKSLDESLRRAIEMPAGGVTEEQLLFAVRALPFEEGYERTIAVLPRLVDNQLPDIDWRSGTIEVTGREEIRDAQGARHETWRIDIVLEGGDQLNYNVGVEPPHALIYHAAPENYSLRLRTLRRWDYWNF